MKDRQLRTALERSGIIQIRGGYDTLPQPEAEVNVRFLERRISAIEEFLGVEIQEIAPKLVAVKKESSK